MGALAEKTLILGLGNDILGDDAFGLHVVRRLMQTLAAQKADCVECSASGFRLLDYLEGYDRAIIVDSYLGPERTLGEVLAFDIADDAGPLPSSGSHFFSFPHTLAAGRVMGMKLPSRIRAYCAVIHGYAFSEHGIADALKPAAEEIIRRVLSDLSQPAPRA
jgi:hydrogenase maturation protease